MSAVRPPHLREQIMLFALAALLLLMVLAIGAADAVTDPTIDQRAAPNAPIEGGTP